MKSKPLYFLRQQGFSLLEVLVAFSILTLLLGVVLHIFSNGVRMAELSGEYSRAMQMAQSLLATAGVEEKLEEGESRGMTADRYRWRVGVTPYLPEIEEVDFDLLPVVPYRVDVSVGWEEGGAERSVNLTTLRLEGRAPQ